MIQNLHENTTIDSIHFLVRDFELDHDLAILQQEQFDLNREFKDKEKFVEHNNSKVIEKRPVLVIPGFRKKSFIVRFISEDEAYRAFRSLNGHYVHNQLLSIIKYKYITENKDSIILYMFCGLTRNQTERIFWITNVCCKIWTNECKFMLGHFRNNLKEGPLMMLHIPMK